MNRELLDDEDWKNLEMSNNLDEQTVLNVVMVLPGSLDHHCSGSGRRRLLWIAVAEAKDVIEPSSCPDIFEVICWARR